MRARRRDVRLRRLVLAALRAAASANVSPPSPPAFGAMPRRHGFATGATRASGRGHRRDVRAQLWSRPDPSRAGAPGAARVLVVRKSHEVHLQPPGRATRVNITAVWTVALARALRSNDPGRRTAVMFRAPRHPSFSLTRRARIAMRVWQHVRVLPGPAGGNGRRAHPRSAWPEGRAGSIPAPGTGQVIGALTGFPRPGIVTVLRGCLRRRV